MEKINITVKGPLLYGSITTAMAKCGNPNCKCHRNPALMHGPYYRWTGIIDGKRTTVTISREEAKECQRRIKNYKKFQEQIKKIVKKALDQAPWNLR